MWTADSQRPQCHGCNKDSGPFDGNTTVAAAARSSVTIVPKAGPSLGSPQRNRNAVVDLSNGSVRVCTPCLNQINTAGFGRSSGRASFVVEDPTANPCSGINAWAEDRRGRWAWTAKKFFSRIRLLGGGAVDKSLRRTKSKTPRGRKRSGRCIGSTRTCHYLGCYQTHLQESSYREGAQCAAHRRCWSPRLGRCENRKSVMAHPHIKDEGSPARVWLTKVNRRSCGSPSTLLNSLPLDLPRNLRVTPCQNISERFKGKKWLVLFDPPLAGFESTADSPYGRHQTTSNR